MALDIVTAYQGTNHVTAAQMADFQRGLLGGDCILPVGNKMETEIQTANQITVADGVVVFDGIEFHIGYGQSENVAITSGTQGMMRNDIVCIQYSKDESSGIESAEFVTIAGTPAASDPQDPAYSNLDIRTGVFMSQKPFCRVRLNGTAIEGIDMLVETFDMGIYQLNKDLADTGWIYPELTSQFVDYSEEWKPAYRLKNGYVEVKGAVKPKTSIAGSQDETIIFTLPEGFRPARHHIPVLCQGSARDIWLFQLRTDGAVTFSRYRETNTYKTATNSSWLPFQVVFSPD